jgi:hypothetical protein
MQSFDRALCRALVEPRAEPYAEPCAEPRADVQTYRRADMQTFVLAINCKDVRRDDCLGNYMEI